MAYRVIVIKETPHPSGSTTEDTIYKQTVENVDIPSIILAVNSASVKETLKSWFGDLLPKK